jgi:hypothetical protein
MKKVLAIFVLLTIVCLGFAQQNMTIAPSSHPVLKERPADYEYLSAPDSLGKRRPIKMPSQTTSTGIHLPYPIILIHGLLKPGIP